MGEPNIEHTIDHNTVSNISFFSASYDKKSDTLYLQPDKPLPSVCLDWDGQFWVMVDPENNQIVGIQIDDYKKYFSKLYSSVLGGKRIKDPIIKRFIMMLLMGVIEVHPFTRKDFTADLEKVASKVA